MTTPDTVAVGEVDHRRDAAQAPTATLEPIYRWSKTRTAIYEFDRKTVAFARTAYPTVARGALFVVFLWFGFIKLLGVSEAASLALALTSSRQPLDWQAPLRGAPSSCTSCDLT